MPLLPSYRMPASRPASFLNREAAIGGVLGLGLMAATGVSTFIGLPFLLPVALGAAAIGGVAGRQRMAREAEEGVLVRPPDFWNSGLMFGLGAGLVAAMVMAPVLGIAGAGVGLLFGMAGQLGGAAWGLGALLSVGGGMFLGATAVERRQQVQYALAQEKGKKIGPAAQPAQGPAQPPALPARAPAVALDAPAPPPPAYGDDAQRLRGFLDKEMERRAMAKRNYPFVGK